MMKVCPLPRSQLNVVTSEDLKTVDLNPRKWMSGLMLQLVTHTLIKQILLFSD